MSSTLVSLVVALSTSQPTPTSAPLSTPAPAMRYDHGEGGHVTLPLTHWSVLTEAASAAPDRAAPPAAITYTDRRIEGVFRKGLLRATLTARFEVYDDRGYLQVPVITDGASPGKVELNGQPTSLVRHLGMYTVGVDKPGSYEVIVTFYRGQEQDRFARRLQLDLPEGGVTSVSLQLPEVGIDARLDGGALTAQTEVEGATLVEGFLGASGQLDLSWTRRLAHTAATGVRLETELDTLITLGEGLVSGVAVFNLDVREGETDRIDLVLPPEVEIMRVSGDAVLQWRTDPSKPTALNVLLRYLVRDETRVVVHYQYPVASDAKTIPVRTLLPPAGTPLTGTLGVQAPAGLDVTVANADAATALTLRELPSSLTGLTSKPLLFGFRFEAPPNIALTVSRHAAVELTSTLIDEIQASTVLLEDGTEVTKMRLDIRNNTRQYLEVTLPGDSELTHALLDGHPVRPALKPGQPGTLLFTLRQSERVEPEGRTHLVQNGETLGGLAHRYFGDPGKWALILDANDRRLGGSSNILVGQTLIIPTDSSVTVEESAFVLELAYRSSRHGTLGGWGSADLALPTLDVDAMRATWHLYVPPNLAALDFSTNLTQLDNHRYGTLRRLEQFLDGVFGIGQAQAGGYESILTKRRSIYRDEARQKTMAEVAPATFPYVGERYRFKRVLSDAVAPTITFMYLSEGMAIGVRIAAFMLALLLALFVLRVNAPWWRWPVGLAGMVGLMVVAYYVLGVHRMLVWGVLAGVLVALWRIRHSRPPSTLATVLRTPWELGQLASLRNILIGIGLIVVADFVLRHPRLLPFAAIVVLTLLWHTWATHTPVVAPASPPLSQAPTEVHHAAI